MFRIEGLRFKVYGSGFGIYVLGTRDFVFRVWGLGFDDEGYGFSVQKSVFGV